MTREVRRAAIRSCPYCIDSEPDWAEVDRFLWVTLFLTCSDMLVMQVHQSIAPTCRVDLNVGYHERTTGGALETHWVKKLGRSWSKPFTCYLQYDREKSLLNQPKQCSVVGWNKTIAQACKRDSQKPLGQHFSICCCGKHNSISSSSSSLALSRRLRWLWRWWVKVEVGGGGLK